MDEPSSDWRSWVRRKVGWLLLFKLAALIALWLLFFSPAHRVSVDSGVMSQRVAPTSEEPTNRTSSEPVQVDPDDV